MTPFQRPVLGPASWSRPLRVHTLALVKLAAATCGLAVVGVMAGGCTGRASPQFVKNGIVAGFAAACANQALPDRSVQVSANAHGRAVATVVVDSLKDHLRYKLSMPPGRYVLRAFGTADSPQVVLLHPGEHVTVSFRHCN